MFVFIPIVLCAGLFPARILISHINTPFSSFSSGIPISREEAKRIVKRFSVNGTSIKFREFLRAFYTSSSGASGKTQALEVCMCDGSLNAVLCFVALVSPTDFSLLSSVFILLCSPSYDASGQFSAAVGRTLVAC